MFTLSSYLLKEWKLKLRYTVELPKAIYQNWNWNCLFLWYMIKSKDSLIILDRILYKQEDYRSVRLNSILLLPLVTKPWKLSLCFFFGGLRCGYLLSLHPSLSLICPLATENYYRTGITGNTKTHRQRLNLILSPNRIKYTMVLTKYDKVWP